ncbi:hypothetical protein BDV26DRAFT_166423 [Aspergillus bertholletiae]|uniref:Secreted protein n=1 Tax=Aspergillus bertholletiae TaxID=1226010 RepID=A0A5N7BCA8_9EURO|nr:hypothetical protein BDV26DRAFT_166423 [Aspergillus bertholletiae]
MGIEGIGSSIFLFALSALPLPPWAMCNPHTPISCFSICCKRQSKASNVPVRLHALLKTWRTSLSVPRSNLSLTEGYLHIKGHEVHLAT